MGDNDFILDQMIWSFSRIKSFGNCPYEWYLNYIDCYPDKSKNIYGEFGGYCHKILEKYLNFELEKEELVPYYMEYFDDNVTSIVLSKYNPYDKLLEIGFNYFGNINLDPRKMDIIGVEQDFIVNLERYRFTGFIDVLYKEGDDFIVLDHKSCEYPLTKSGAPKKSKQEELVSFKRQLYLYSLYVKEKYGKYPKYLEWNFFREGKLYRIEFDEQELQESIDWALNSIKEIYNTVEFKPHKSYFYCNNLCDYRNDCKYNG